MSKELLLQGLLPERSTVWIIETTWCREGNYRTLDNSLVGRSSSTLSTTKQRTLSKYKDVWDLQNLTEVIMNILGCDTMLSGRFTANILEQPAAPTFHSKETSSFRVDKGGSRFFRKTSIYLQDNTLSHPKKKILIFKYKQHQILKNKKTFSQKNMVHSSLQQKF